nr:hypothetical transcript [Hymenolepis microstoma]CUU99721.1 hypothetical transcript [Hymenolepis microstoma]
METFTLTSPHTSLSGQFLTEKANKNERAQEIFWRGDLSYFDNVRIASSVLILAGCLITALPTRLYENIEDWIQRRRSPLELYHSSNVSSTAASGAVSGGPDSSNQPVKAAGPLTANISLSPINEHSLRRPTLTLPMPRRNLLRSNSISINRGR